MVCQEQNMLFPHNLKRECLLFFRMVFNIILFRCTAFKLRIVHGSALKLHQPKQSDWDKIQNPN